jgi:hypothetical protein
MHSCESCGYCQKMKDKQGGEWYYCNDIDCEVDPYDVPPCSEENYNS